MFAPRFSIMILFFLTYSSDTVQFTFPGSSYSLISGNLAAFASQLKGVAVGIVGSLPYGNITVQINATSAGIVLATLTVPSLSVQTGLGNAITSGQLSFVFNTFNYVASFALNYGLCPAGTISPNGYEPNCYTCPANTYVCKASISMCLRI